MAEAKNEQVGIQLETLDILERRINAAPDKEIKEIIAGYKNELLARATRDGNAGVAGEKATPLAPEEKPDVISQPTIDRAMAAAKKVYPDSPLAAPSLDAVAKALSNEKQQGEIAKRHQPTLCLMQVRQKSGPIQWRPVVVDGIAEMPLEAGAKGKSREERILAMRKLREEDANEYLKEFDDDELHTLLGHIANDQGMPIDQLYWTMLTAKFTKGDMFVRGAVWGGGRSVRVEGCADYVNDRGRLRSAVWGDVIA